MELWDIYDIDRNPSGNTAVRGEKLGENCYHLVVHVCIFSSDGRMLIQQRQSTKSWANKWDISCGGCAVKGENSRQAAHRELYEELGIDIDFDGMRPALSMNFDHGFDDFYLITKDLDASELRLQAAEVQAVRWASKEEILSLIDTGKFIPFFKSFVCLLFDIRKKPDCLNI